MEQIVQQLLELLLPLFWGALPTVLIVFFLFFFLRWAFWQPFQRVLAEREAATEGARQQAETILGTASEKLHQYEEALRRARAEIYREQESARQGALQERNRTLQKTRQQAAESLRQAKLSLAREVEQAKRDLEQESQRLGEQITRTLLAPVSRRASNPRGSRPPRGSTQ